MEQKKWASKPSAPQLQKKEQIFKVKAPEPKLKKQAKEETEEEETEEPREVLTEQFKKSAKTANYQQQKTPDIKMKKDKKSLPTTNFQNALSSVQKVQTEYKNKEQKDQFLNEEKKDSKNQIAVRSQNTKESTDNADWHQSESRFQNEAETAGEIEQIQENDDDEDRTQLPTQLKILKEQSSQQANTSGSIISKNQNMKDSITNSDQFQKLVQNIKQKAINFIQYDDLQTNGSLLGEGGFGSVYQGTWTNTQVAIKEMMLSYEEFKTMDSEMTFMAKSRHPTLVSMYGVAIEEIRNNKLHCCIVMELMSTDLETHIFKNNKGRISLSEKVRILKEVTEGVSFLHGAQIVHRDLKPKNILLDKNNKAKITDLGIAKALENKQQTQNCTIAFTARYVSKETACDEVTSYSSDIWSLGCVFYEVITESFIWDNLTSNKIIISLSQEKSPFAANYEQKIQNAELIQLVKDCCNYNPDSRPKAKDVYTRLDKIQQNMKNNPFQQTQQQLQSEQQESVSEQLDDIDMYIPDKKGKNQKMVQRKK